MKALQTLALSILLVPALSCIFLPAFGVRAAAATRLIFPGVWGGDAQRNLYGIGMRVNISFK